MGRKVLGQGSRSARRLSGYTDFEARAHYGIQPFGNSDSGHGRNGVDDAWIDHRRHSKPV